MLGFRSAAVPAEQNAEHRMERSIAVFCVVISFGSPIPIIPNLDRFGAEEAERLFYWNNQQYVEVSPEQCHALLLKHPTNGVLTFITNLCPDAQTVTVQLNLNKLNLRGKKLDVFNALTDEPIAMTDDGKLSVPLGSEQWLYVWHRTVVTAPHKR